jgi:O-antigen/teichoic acid export membrane protein
MTPPQQSTSGTVAVSPLKKLSANIVATASSTALLAVSNLLLVPLFLRYWSPLRYGEWLTISSLAAYLASADLGMTSAAINDLSQSYCIRDIKRFAQVLRTAFTGYIGFACLGTVFGFVLFRYLPLGWMGIHRRSDQVAIAAGLLVAQVAWSFPLNLVLSFYRIIGNFSTSQWLGNLYRVLLAASTGCALVAGAQFVQIAAVQLVVPVAMIGITAAVIKLRHPSLAPGFGRISLKEAGALLQAGSPFALMTIGNTISQQGPILIISSTLGPLIVTPFSTARTLMNSMRQLVGVLASASWPELTLAQASGQQEVARKIHRVLVIASVSGSTASGATLWFVGAQIMKAWTHKELPFSTSLIRCFAAQLILQSPWLASSLVSNSANKNRYLSLLYTGSAIVGIILSALTIHRFGVLGVPMSLAVAEACICSHAVIKDSCTLLGQSYRSFATKLWTRLPLLIAAAFATAALMSHIGTEFVVTRVALVLAGTSLVTCTVSWLWWIEADDNRGIVGRLFHFASRRIAWRPL